MTIYATFKKQIIRLDGPMQLKYVEGRPEVRRYDACYYEIKHDLEDNIRLNFTDLTLYVKINKLLNINAFIY